MCRTCNTPNKRKLKNQTEAYKNAISLSRKSGRPIRAYRCHCGWWHLTSQVVR